MTFDKACTHRPRGPLSLTRARQPGRKKTNRLVWQTMAAHLFFRQQFKREGNFFFKEETLGTVNKKTDPNLKLLDKKWGP
jgi:hypothetical protein